MGAIQYTTFWIYICAGCGFIGICADIGGRDIFHKVCSGTDYTSSYTLGYPRIKEMFEECTYVNGSLDMNSFQIRNVTSDLSFLKNILEVTGYVRFANAHTDTLHLNNLRIIRGQQLTGEGAALHLQWNYQTGYNPLNIGLKQLGLVSLREIANGDVLIRNNQQLCYENTIKWADVLTGEGARVRFDDIPSSDNNNKRNCPACHENCANEHTGRRHCWGEGPNMCQTLSRTVCSPECKNNCFGAGPEHCCYQECMGGCHGPGNRECWACRGFNMAGAGCFPSCQPVEIFNQQTHQREPNRIPKAQVAFGHLCLPRCPGETYDMLGHCMIDCGPNHFGKDGKCHPCEGPCPKNGTRTTENNPEFDTLETAASHAERIIAGVVASVLIIAISILSIIVVICYRKRKRERVYLDLEVRYYRAEEETQPLTPTGVAPNMALLRLIKESELRRDKIIGSGAFGKVYKGFWLPEGEGIKIPVAIKQLHDNSAGQTREMLEEAHIMASVNHPHCVHILAMCISTHVMLITQLMPHGCLLEYVRMNKAKLGSETLLNWCAQIAKGMAHLEEKAIVHRDLAARNVLVYRPGHVKITDFGLAKLLDHQQEEYKSGGGKLPIKWLALESLNNRCFTHKSDVWSYGVTIWEILTWGEQPYDGVRLEKLCELLENGERLPQPTICSIDVYMTMIKCWMTDVKSRPSFQELAQEFSQMAVDPGRYLVIPGDALMRLPDVNERISSMQREESENIMNADVYLDRLNFFTKGNCENTYTPEPESFTEDKLPGRYVPTEGSAKNLTTTDPLRRNNIPMVDDAGYLQPWSERGSVMGDTASLQPYPSSKQPYVDNTDAQGYLEPQQQKTIHTSYMNTNGDATQKRK